MGEFIAIRRIQFNGRKQALRFRPILRKSIGARKGSSEKAINNRSRSGWFVHLFQEPKVKIISLDRMSLYFMAVPASDFISRMVRGQCEFGAIARTPGTVCYGV
jgi:hypothetical protein